MGKQLYNYIIQFTDSRPYNIGIQSDVVRSGLI